LSRLNNKKSDLKTSEATKKLLKEIEAIKPDHEQRKLAIEVSS
jgi:hypothetical protein